MTRAKRTDKNQQEIIDALLAVGCTVVDLHAIGQAGVPDLLVGRDSVNYLIEIKGLGGRIERAQLEFAATWRGLKQQIVWDVDGALRAVGVRTASSTLEMD